MRHLEYFDFRDESIAHGGRSVHFTDGDQLYMQQWRVPGLRPVA